MLRFLADICGILADICGILATTDLGEDESLVMVTRQQVVDQHNLPFAILTEPDLVRPLGAVVLSQDDALYQFWTLSQHSECTQEPKEKAALDNLTSPKPLLYHQCCIHLNI